MFNQVLGNVERVGVQQQVMGRGAFFLSDSELQLLIVELLNLNYRDAHSSKQSVEGVLKREVDSPVGLDCTEVSRAERRRCVVLACILLEIHAKRHFKAQLACLSSSKLMLEYLSRRKYVWVTV